MRSSRKPSHRAAIFWILAIAYLFVYFHRVSLAVVASEVAESFHTSGASLGVLASAYFYLYAFMQLPVGYITDFFGPRKTITVFLCIASAGSILFGLSTNMPTAVVGRILVGLGVSAVFVPALKVLSEWYKKNEFATMTGLLMAAGSVGWLSAATPLALLVDCVGWRSAFLLISFVTLAISALAWVFINDANFDNSSRPNQKRKAVSKTSFLNSGKMILSQKYFWPPAIWMMLSYGALIGYGGLWGGPYLMNIYGLSKTETGNILMMVGLGMMIGGPVSGWLSDKVFRSRKSVVLLGAFCFSIPWILLVVWTDNLPVFVLFSLSFAIGFVDRAVNVVLFASNKELFPKDIVGTSTGLLNMFPFIGGALFPPVMGFIIDRSLSVAPIMSYKYAFIFCLVAAVVGLISTCFMRDHR
jgi:sugar phosphate permease